MFVIYENATNNEEPKCKEFVFVPQADHVQCNGKNYYNVVSIQLQVKRKGKVKATSHPKQIKTYVNTKGLRK